MTISPGKRDGEITEYPKGCRIVFQYELTLISALASFDTPLKPVIEFIGKMDNSFDLGLDVEVDDISQNGTRVDDDGISHNTKYISFGFNKDFEKKFGDQKDDEEEDDKKEKVTDKLKDAVNSSTEASEKSKTRNVVESNTKDAKQNPKKLSAGGTFNFEFAISLVLTIEEGGTYADGIFIADGYQYFSSLILIAEGSVNFGSKVSYVTPIGIPIFASIDFTGNASAILGIEANDSERYVEKYRFAEMGKYLLLP